MTKNLKNIYSLLQMDTREKKKYHKELRQIKEMVSESYEYYLVDPNNENDLSDSDMREIISYISRWQSALDTFSSFNKEVKKQEDILETMKEIEYECFSGLCEILTFEEIE